MTPSIFFSSISEKISSRSSGTPHQESLPPLSAVSVHKVPEAITLKVALELLSFSLSHCFWTGPSIVPFLKSR